MQAKLVRNLLCFRIGLSRGQSRSRHGRFRASKVREKFPRQSRLLLVLSLWCLKVGILKASLGFGVVCSDAVNFLRQHVPRPASVSSLRFPNLLNFVTRRLLVRRDVDSERHRLVGSGGADDGFRGYDDRHQLRERHHGERGRRRRPAELLRREGPLHEAGK